jgi:outer membrane receptor for monomeric catechols
MPPCTGVFQIKQTYGTNDSNRQAGCPKSRKTQEKQTREKTQVVKTNLTLRKRSHVIYHLVRAAWLLTQQENAWSCYAYVWTPLNNFLQVSLFLTAVSSSPTHTCSLPPPPRPVSHHAANQPDNTNATLLAVCK